MFGSTRVSFSSLGALGIKKSGGEFIDELIKGTSLNENANRTQSKVRTFY